MPNSQKKSRLWAFLTAYFAGNSTGIRNWLLVTAAFTFITLLVFIGFFGLTIASPLYFGLLIGFGALMAGGIIGSLVSGLFALYNDYQAYKNRPGSGKNYLLHLLEQLWEWVQTHPFTTFFFALIFGVFLYGIGSLVILGAAALATPAILFISHALGELSLPFIISTLYTSVAFLLMAIVDFVSRIVDLQDSAQATAREEVDTPTTSSYTPKPSSQRTTSKAPPLSYTPPLAQTKSNTTVILESGEVASYSPKATELTKITENNPPSGSYDNRFKTQPIEQITFKCLASSYFVVAYNQISKQYFFLNISQSQANDREICTRFFKHYSGATFNIWYFQLNDRIIVPFRLGIPSNNISTFIVGEEQPGTVEKASFTLKSGILQITYDGQEESKEYIWKMDGDPQPTTTTPTQTGPQST